MKVWRFKFEYVDEALCPLCEKKIEDLRQHLTKDHSTYDLVNFLIEHTKKERR